MFWWLWDHLYVIMLWSSYWKYELSAIVCGYVVKHWYALLVLLCSYFAQSWIVKYHINIYLDLLMCLQLNCYRPLSNLNILPVIMATGFEDASDLFGGVSSFKEIKDSFLAWWFIYFLCGNVLHKTSYLRWYIIKHILNWFHPYVRSSPIKHPQRTIYKTVVGCSISWRPPLHSYHHMGAAYLSCLSS